MSKTNPIGLRFDYAVQNARISCSTETPWFVVCSLQPQWMFKFVVEILDCKTDHGESKNDYIAISVIIQAGHGKLDRKR